jgi:uncharacterized membrane protein YjdF
MNRPKNAPLLAALVAVAALLSAAAVWSLLDWSEDAAAATERGGAP